jgi:hypothetical protein
LKPRCKWVGLRAGFVEQDVRRIHRIERRNPRILWPIFGTRRFQHLRCFFEKAPDHSVGRLLADLIIHGRQTGKERTFSPLTHADLKRFDRCQVIADRLKRETGVANLDALRPYTDDKVLAEDDPVAEWRERMLDLFDGMGRRAPLAAAA